LHWLRAIDSFYVSNPPIRNLIANQPGGFWINNSQDLLAKWNTDEGFENRNSALGPGDYELPAGYA
jgi:hypothetical protein